MTCIICGRMTHTVTAAYYECDNGDIFHIDCDDPNGSSFGDDGMPTSETDGTKMIASLNI